MTHDAREKLERALCPACSAHRVHSPEEWKNHPFRGHGYTRETGWTRSKLALAIEHYRLADPPPPDHATQPRERLHGLRTTTRWIARRTTAGCHAELGQVTATSQTSSSNPPPLA